MATATRLGAYGAGLALVFAAALGAGSLAGPTGAAADSSSPAGGAATDHGTTGHEPEPQAPSADVGLPGGLAVSQDGYTLTPARTTWTAGQQGSYRFTITGPDGRPVTAYTRQHDQDLHLVVVRRGLSGYQHLHPTLGPDGVWSQPLRLPTGGDHRVYADFRPATTATSLTLGTDLHVAGRYQPTPLPAPARSTTVDGYTVTLAGDLRPGQASPLTLSVTRAGRPVTDLQPYLAAYGHLVALRQGDLAYLHVHPEGHPGDGTTPAGPAITFTAEVPTAGTYRLYLDFRHGGVVRTAELTATTA